MHESGEKRYPLAAGKQSVFNHTSTSAATRCVYLGCRSWARGFYCLLPHILLDIYPYPETDIACDLTAVNPFQKDCLDAFLLFNVLEPVQSPTALLTSLWNILKPDGRIFITIPFMLKIHQAPLDFQRLTHFALQDLAQQTSFEIIHLDEVYDPVGLIHESTRYYRFWTRSEQKRMNRVLTSIELTALSWHTDLLGKFSPKTYTNHLLIQIILHHSDING